MRVFWFLVGVVCCLWGPRVGAQQLPNYTDPVRTFLQAQQLYDAHKYGAAQGLYAQVWRNPATLPDQRVEAQALVAICAYHLMRAEARALLERFIEAHPTNSRAPQARFLVGKLLFLQKKYDQAPRHLEQADPRLLSEADYVESQFLLGYSFYKTQKREQAATVLAPLCDRLGEYHDKANYYYGVVQFERREFADALKAFRNIEQAGEYGDKIPVYICGSLVGLNAVDELEAYGKTLQTTEAEVDQKGEIYRRIATVLYEHEHFERALPFFDLALKQGLTFDRATRYLHGYALHATGQSTEALAQFKPLLAGADHLAQLAAYYSGFAWLKNGKPTEAFKAFDRAAQLNLVEGLALEATLQAGRAAFEARQLKTARERFLAWIPQAPDSAADRVQELKALIGETYLVEGNYQAALDFYEQANVGTPRALAGVQRAAYHLGVQQYKARNWEAARSLFAKARQSDADLTLYRDALFFQAELDLFTDKYAEARAKYESFLGVGSAGASAYVADAHLGIAWTHLKQENHAAAAEALEAAAAAAESRPALLAEIRLRQADLQFHDKNYTAALAGYTAAIKNHPTARDYATLQRGLANARLDRKKAALEDFQKVVQTWPLSDVAPRALFELADATLKWNADYAQAQHHARRILAEYPKADVAAQASNLIGYACINSDNTAGAIEAFRQTLTLYGDRREAAQSAADELAMLLPPNEFARTLEAFHRANPSTRLKVDNLACTVGRELAEVEQNYADAIPQLCDCITNPSNDEVLFEALNLRAEAYTHTRQTEKALADYRQVYEAPNAPPTHAVKALIGAAEIRSGQQKHAEAETLLARADALAQSPADRMTVRFGLGSLQLTKGNYSAARASYQSVLGLPKLTAYARNRAELGMAHALVGEEKPDSALALANAILDREPTSVYGAEAACIKVRVLFEEERHADCYEQAVALARQYKSHNVWRARIFLILAQNYFEQGDKDQALSTLESILKNAPSEAIKAEAKALKSALEKRKAPEPKKALENDDRPAASPAPEDDDETSMR
jgi:tetratricopeptide (TPR) repeat protein